jgi:DNA-binding XRE family transcriptional regulator
MTIKTNSKKIMCVYVIKSDAGPIKIGISSNPENRLKSLQGSSPYTLTIYFVKAVNGGVAESIERQAHDSLAKNRLRGEWFNVAADDAVYVVNMAINNPVHETCTIGSHEESPYAIASQIKAARILLEWEQLDLAKKSGLSITTITSIESKKRCPSHNTRKLIIDAIDKAGVEFFGERKGVHGFGVRYKVNRRDEGDYNDSTPCELHQGPR